MRRTGPTHSCRSAASTRSRFIQIGRNRLRRSPVAVEWSGERARRSPLESTNASREDSRAEARRSGEGTRLLAVGGNGLETGFQHLGLLELSGLGSGLSPGSRDRAHRRRSATTASRSALRAPTPIPTTSPKERRREIKAALEGERPGAREHASRAGRRAWIQCRFADPGGARRRDRSIQEGDRALRRMGRQDLPLCCRLADFRNRARAGLGMEPRGADRRSPGRPRTSGVTVAVEPTSADSNLVDTVDDALSIMAESGSRTSR